MLINTTGALFLSVCALPAGTVNASPTATRFHWPSMLTFITPESTR
ncbi:MAG: hypothetical protein M3151_08840 [Actinomycetota bacterium]|nr:hypothetical protein [Actinomycetota bacterium]